MKLYLKFKKIKIMINDLYIIIIKKQYNIDNWFILYNNKNVT